MTVVSKLVSKKIANDEVAFEASLKVLTLMMTAAAVGVAALHWFVQHLTDREKADETTQLMATSKGKTTLLPSFASLLPCPPSLSPLCCHSSLPSHLCFSPPLTTPPMSFLTPLFDHTHNTTPLHPHPPHHHTTPSYQAEQQSPTTRKKPSPRPSKPPKSPSCRSSNLSAC